MSITLIQKIKILAIFKNVSEEKIRDCIGSARFYRIIKGSSDLPYNSMMDLFKLLKCTDGEKLWFVSDTDNYPENIELVYKERYTSSDTHKNKAGIERRLAQNQKKPVPP